MYFWRRRREACFCTWEAIRLTMAPVVSKWVLVYRSWNDSEWFAGLKPQTFVARCHNIQIGPNILRFLNRHQWPLKSFLSTCGHPLHKCYSSLNQYTTKLVISTQHLSRWTHSVFRDISFTAKPFPLLTLKNRATYSTWTFKFWSTPWSWFVQIDQSTSCRWCLFLNSRHKAHITLYHPAVID